MKYTFTYKYFVHKVSINALVKKEYNVTTVKPCNKGPFFCRAFVASIERWALLKGFIKLKITALPTCHLALIQGLDLVERGTIEWFHCI